MKIPVFKYLLVYAACLMIFLVMDFFWLGWGAQSFYHEQLGPLLADSIVWPAALAFYFMYIVGLMIFCVAPALKQNSAIKALFLGGLYGFFTYATYELTNYALIRDWPSALVPVDICWGVFLCATVSTGGYWVGRRLAP